MLDLNLFFITFSVRNETGKEWSNHAGYIFAKSVEDIQKLLEKKYGAVYLRTVDSVPIYEGRVLYGKSWKIE